jgi:hypothetical protein
MHVLFKCGWGSTMRAMLKYYNIHNHDFLQFTVLADLRVTRPHAHRPLDSSYCSQDHLSKEHGISQASNNRQIRRLTKPIVGNGDSQQLFLMKSLFRMIHAIEWSSSSSVRIFMSCLCRFGVTFRTCTDLVDFINIIGRSTTWSSHLFVTLEYLMSDNKWTLVEGMA